MGFEVDIVIFKVIKKPLVIRLSQVIHKIVIQNPVRNQEGLRLKNWLLLDRVIIQLPKWDGSLTIFCLWANSLSFRKMGFHFIWHFLIKKANPEQSPNLFPRASRDRLNTSYVLLSQMLPFNIQDFKMKQRTNMALAKDTLFLPWKLYTLSSFWWNGCKK